MAISYCNEAHVHSLYGESEITSLISQAPSIFAVHILPATEVWESGNKTYSFGTQDQNPVCMPVITAKKQFLNNFFCCGGMPSICSYYMH